MPNIEEEEGWPLTASVIYTAAWSLSFYAQIYENCRLKSVQGFSLNYFALSFTGYAYYTVFLSLGCFTDLQGAGTILLADMVFIYHAALMVIIQLIQCIMYKKGKNILAKSTVIIIAAVTLIIIIQAALEVSELVEWHEYWNPLTVVGYGKLFMTFIKGIPQIYWNFHRKSTSGWSIKAVILDLFGGAFLFASGKTSFSDGLNMVKMIVGFISMIYGVIFCVQHYVLYRASERMKLEGEKVVSQSFDVAQHLMQKGEKERSIGLA